jgi:hypothetical protein
MAFSSISLVNDLGILSDIYPLSAIEDSYSCTILCTLCGTYERYKAQHINNEDYMPNLKLSDSSYMSFIMMNEGGEMSDCERIL